MLPGVCCAEFAASLAAHVDDITEVSNPTVVAKARNTVEEEIVMFLIGVVASEGAELELARASMRE